MQKKPNRTVRCVYCGREFIEPMPHKCKGGYRKRKLKWINIMEEDKRKQFNVVEFISNEKTPVETRDGKKVEIFTTTREAEDTYIVVGAVDDRYDYFSWTKEGLYHSDWTESSDFDLFFSIKKKTRRMTNQELAWWLKEHPEEHREYRLNGDDNVYPIFTYSDKTSSYTCAENILIRSNGGEWHEPLIEIEEGNDKRD